MCYISPPSLTLSLCIISCWIEICVEGGGCCDVQMCVKTKHLHWVCIYMGSAKFLSFFFACVSLFYIYYSSHPAYILYPQSMWQVVNCAWRRSSYLSGFDGDLLSQKIFSLYIFIRGGAARWFFVMMTCLSVLSFTANAMLKKKKCCFGKHAAFSFPL